MMSRGRPTHVHELCVRQTQPNAATMVGRRGDRREPPSLLAGSRKEFVRTRAVQGLLRPIRTIPFREPPSKSGARDPACANRVANACWSGARTSNCASCRCTGRLRRATLSHRRRSTPATLYGREARLPTTPDIPGFEEQDGWYVSRRESALASRVRTTPPPRRYGALDQLRVDLRSPVSLPVYAAVLAAIIYGGATQDWVALAIGVGAVAFFSRGFISSIRAVRRGVVATVEIRDVQHAIGQRQGVNENMKVSGREMNVAFDLSVVRALLESEESVVAEVLVDPADKRPVASAIAYRIPVSRSGGAGT